MHIHCDWSGTQAPSMPVVHTDSTHRGSTRIRYYRKDTVDAVSADTCMCTGYGDSVVVTTVEVESVYYDMRIDTHKDTVVRHTYERETVVAESLHLFTDTIVCDSMCDQP
jgi:hypothetical protein